MMGKHHKQICAIDTLLANVRGRSGEEIPALVDTLTRYRQRLLDEQHEVKAKEVFEEANRRAYPDGDYTWSQLTPSIRQRYIEFYKLVKAGH